MTDKTGSERGLRLRPFATLLVVACFALLAGSGLVMYFWRALGDKDLMGLDRGAWNALHTMLGWLMVVGAALHLFPNWGVLAGYLKRRTGRGRIYPRECALAMACVAVAVAGTLLQVPPFSRIAPKEKHGRPPVGAPLDQDDGDARTVPPDREGDGGHDR